MNPSLLIYHPNRYLSSHRNSDYLLKFYREVIGSSPEAVFIKKQQDQQFVNPQAWEYLFQNIDACIKEELVELGKPVPTGKNLRQEWLTEIVDDLYQLQYISSYYYNGRSIFDVSAVLAEMFRKTDVEDVPIQSINFSYDALYLYFGPQHDLTIGTDSDFLDGAYVVKGQSRIGIYLTTIRADADYSKTINQLVCPHQYFKCELDCNSGTVGEAFDRALAEHNPMSMTVVNSTLDQMQQLPNDRSIRNAYLEAAGKQAGSFLRDAPVFREALCLVVNSLCFLSAYPDEIEERYPESAPAELIEELQNTPPAKRKRVVQKLSKLGFTRIRFPQIRLTPEKSTPGPSTGRKMPSHWRKGHWRHVPCGPGRQQRKLSWIRPYMVGNDPQHGHIYEAEG